MKKKTAIFTLIIILSLALTACTRSLSTPPAEVPPTAAPESEEEPFVIEEDSTAAEGEGPKTEPTEEAAAQPEAPAAENAATQPAGEAPTAVHDAPAATVAPTQAPVIIVDTPVVPASYVLQQGEFPYCLARRFNVDPGTLLSVNGLNENSWVSPGTTLSIPTSSTWSGASRSRMAHPATYTVKSGDTIYSIACAFGDVFPESIAQANNMQEPYALTVGQTLQIP